MNREPVRHIGPEELAEQGRFTGLVRDHAARPRTYHIVTYGCQMNAHDSETLAGTLSGMGLAEALRREEADMVIFNTCCIRENAERKALGNITWLKEIKRSAPTCSSACAAA